MPKNYKHSLSYALGLIPLMILILSVITASAYEGIETYYIKYDVKSSRNTIVDENLLMVPAKNDFRAEKFSQISTTGVISADPGESKISVEKQIRDNSLKTILVKHGLKSVKTKDYDTIISYEGVVITPLNISKNTYNEEQSTYLYEAQVKFSPIAFPDEWGTLDVKHKIKNIFHEFFQLFK